MFASLASTSVSSASVSASVSSKKKGQGPVDEGKDACKFLHPSLEVVKVCVCVSELQDGDATASLKGIGGVAIDIAGMIWALPQILGGLATTGIDKIPKGFADMIASAVKNTFSHFLVEIELEGGVECYMEQTGDASVLFLTGTAPRESKKCTWEPKINKTVTVEDIVNFVQRERELPYNVFNNNCKRLVYKLVTEVLCNNEFNSYEHFRNKMQADFGIELSFERKEKITNQKG